MVLILGAGLAGLSAAFHLDDRDVLVVERENEVGGLCRSIREQGFTFDYTGHLLHLRDADIRQWIEGLMPGAFAHLERSAWIHSHDVLTPYPFQVNTSNLPLAVRLECLTGFIETLRHPERRAIPVPDAVSVEPGLPHLAVAPPPAEGEPNFLDWIHDSFGAGFAQHFFVPYNGKLWRRDLAQVTGDWVSWSIPRPELSDVLRGAITGSDKAFGYNPQFLYPAAGGIDHLPRALAAALPADRIRLDTSVVSLDAGARRATFAGGETHDAETILTSIPLPTLARMTTDLPDALRDTAAELSHVSIRAVNLGVRGEAAHADAQWIYVPEPRLPFHRVGLPAALTPAMAPPGHHALVAEIAYLPDDEPGAEAHLQQTIDGLLELGLLRSPDDIVHTRVVDIPEAYVVFDSARRRALPELFRWYVQRRVVPMGRYGSWDYTSMEDSLRHGRSVAGWIREPTS